VPMRDAPRALSPEPRTSTPESKSTFPATNTPAACRSTFPA
jgi:hypothetical protein